MTGEARAGGFGHPVRVETIRQRGSDVIVAPDERQRHAIAAALDIASLERLEGRYVLSRNGDEVRLDGRIVAALHQLCVVTLDPFPVTLDVPVSLGFAPAADAPSSRQSDSGDEIDIEFALDGDDPPEPIVDGVIDLGAMTVEFLSLALDPYPRKPGASFDRPAPADATESPFAALAKLKRDE
jgi:uncharacterized metal-binding protein YceD (DUF177 family)